MTTMLQCICCTDTPEGDCTVLQEQQERQGDIKHQQVFMVADQKHQKQTPETSAAYIKEKDVSTVRVIQLGCGVHNLLIGVCLQVWVLCLQQ